MNLGNFKRLMSINLPTPMFRKKQSRHMKHPSSLHGNCLLRLWPKECYPAKHPNGQGSHPLISSSKAWVIVSPVEALCVKLCIHSVWPPRRMDLLFREPAYSVNHLNHPSNWTTWSSGMKTRQSACRNRRFANNAQSLRMMN